MLTKVVKMHNFNKTLNTAKAGRPSSLRIWTREANLQYGNWDRSQRRITIDARASATALVEGNLLAMAPAISFPTLIRIKSDRKQKKQLSPAMDFHSFVSTSLPQSISTYEMSKCAKAYYHHIVPGLSSAAIDAKMSNLLPADKAAQVLNNIHKAVATVGSSYATTELIKPYLWPCQQLYVTRSKWTQEMVTTIVSSIKLVDVIDDVEQINEDDKLLGKRNRIEHARSIRSFGESSIEYVCAQQFYQHRLFNEGVYKPTNTQTEPKFTFGHVPMYVEIRPITNHTRVDELLQMDHPYLRSGRGGPNIKSNRQWCIVDGHNVNAEHLKATAVIIDGVPRLFVRVGEKEGQLSPDFAPWHEKNGSISAWYARSPELYVPTNAPAYHLVPKNKIHSHEVTMNVTLNIFIHFINLEFIFIH